MWNRITEKQKAKSFLKNNLKKCVIITVVYCLISLLWCGEPDYGKNPFEIIEVNTDVEVQGHKFPVEFNKTNIYSIGTTVRDHIQDNVGIKNLDRRQFYIDQGYFFALSGVAILLAIVISLNFNTGFKRFFLRDDGEVSDLFYYFKDGRYAPVLKSRFTIGLNIFLWTLLFIIPGIIKHYQYYFTPYIIAENPHISADEAKKISSNLTAGRKFDIWVAELSFIGWIFLAALTFNIGFLILIPYTERTFANIYRTSAEGIDESEAVIEAIE